MVNTRNNKRKQPSSSAINQPATQPDNSQPEVAQVDTPPEPVGAHAPTISKQQQQHVGSMSNMFGCSALEDSVPRYSGISCGNPYTWMGKYNRYSALKGWDEQTKTLSLPLFLRGSASQWYDSLEEEVSSSFSAVTDAFVEEFTPSQAHQLAKLEQLTSRKQKRNETLENYFCEISKMCRELGRTQKQEMEQVIHGLLPDIKRQVLIQEPNTLKDVRRIAQLIATVTNGEEDQQAVNAVVVSEVESLRAQLKKATDEIELLKKKRRPWHQLPYQQRQTAPQTNQEVAPPQQAVSEQQQVAPQQQAAV